MSQLRKINKSLKADFGIAPGDALGRAHFRLAQTTQIEKRIGNVIKETDSGVFLGVKSGVHEMPKYNFGGHFESPKWVLERLMFAPLPEVPETAKGSYEPVHVFPHVEGDRGIPPYDVIQLFIHMLLYGPRKTFNDYVYEDEKTFKKEVDLGVDILEDQNSNFQSQLHDGEAIVVPRTFEKQETTK